MMRSMGEHSLTRAVHLSMRWCILRAHTDDTCRMKLPASVQKFGLQSGRHGADDTALSLAANQPVSSQALQHYSLSQPCQHSES